MNLSISFSTAPSRSTAAVMHCSIAAFPLTKAVIEVDLKIYEDLRDRLSKRSIRRQHSDPPYQHCNQQVQI